MSDLHAFDPTKHIIVARDKVTGRHTHVEWQSVIQQVAAAPVIQQSKPLDITPILQRLAAIESRKPEPQDLSGLINAVNDVAAQLAQITDRLLKLEAQHATHEHNYKLSDPQLQVIASAVLGEMEKERAA